MSVWVSFSDKESKEINTIFGGEPDKKDWPFSAEVKEDDPRLVAYLSKVAEAQAWPL